MYVDLQDLVTKKKKTNIVNPFRAHVLISFHAFQYFSYAGKTLESIELNRINTKWVNNAKLRDIIWSKYSYRHIQNPVKNLRWSVN